MTHRHRSALRPSAALGFALALGGAAPARAQTDSDASATAQALFDQATVAMDKRDYASACPMLAEAVRLKPSAVGGKLTLGECYEGSGRLATAWATYAAAEAAALNAGQPDRAKTAAKKAQALKGRLATMTVVVPEAFRKAAGLAVKRDGVAVGEGQWGVALPVDRGKHTVSVQATGRAHWERQLDAKDGEASIVTVALGDELRPVAAVPIAQPLRPVGAGFKPAPTPPAAAAPSPQPQPSRSWVIPGIAIGTAVAGFGLMGVGTGLLVAAKSTIANECDAAKHCTPAGLDAASSVGPLSAVGTVGFVVGVAGAAGFVTWLLWPASKPAAESAHLAPVVAPGYAGFQLGRAF